MKEEKRSRRQTSWTAVIVFVGAIMAADTDHWREDGERNGDARRLEEEDFLEIEMKRWRRSKRRTNLKPRISGFVDRDGPRDGSLNTRTCGKRQSHGRCTLSVGQPKTKCKTFTQISKGRVRCARTIASLVGDFLEAMPP